MQIGAYQLENPLILAPMAGITDRPFRAICKQFGAALTVSEMVASNPGLRHHPRTLKRIEHSTESGIRAVQILGTDPEQMADAARFNVDRGAQIIDINMGCPAKKVCSVAAGSALMKNEPLVARILEAVVTAVDVPVTLKIRTGWDNNHKNAPTIARIAEHSGIQALTVHGRTRACKFNGQAEYDTIRTIKNSISIPVIANGDITSAEKARHVLSHTGADAVMIGRAAQGRPWIFADILGSLSDDPGTTLPSVDSIQSIIQNHLENLYSFYGSFTGVRIARKHIGWYFDHLGNIPKTHRKAINQAESPADQLALLNASFDEFLYGIV